MNEYHKFYDTKPKMIQVNNLKIKQNKEKTKWIVITPDKRVLEEFRFMIDAIKFAQETKDFLTKL